MASFATDFRHKPDKTSADRLFDSPKPAGHIEPNDRLAARKTDDGY